MRYDVIHHRCPSQSSLCLAPHTQRVTVQVGLSGRLPAGVVAFLLRALGVVCVERSMLLAVGLAVGNQPGAPRMLAGGVGAARHGHISQGRSGFPKWP